MSDTIRPEPNTLEPFAALGSLGPQLAERFAEDTPAAGMLEDTSAAAGMLPAAGMLEDMPAAAGMLLAAGMPEAERTTADFGKSVEVSVGTSVP